MKKIPKNQIPKKTKLFVPAWVVSDEGVFPCPCGFPPSEDIIFIQGDKDLKRWYHERCFARYHDDEF